MSTIQQSEAVGTKEYAIMSKDELSGSSRNIDAEFGGAEERKKMEKKLLRKLDVRMSILIPMYMLNAIDRNAAAAARLRGFEEDLHLKGQEFATLLSILFVGYSLMQIPSNMLLNPDMGRPSIYIPVCMIVWGVISCLTGVTHNFVGALLTRFWLGFVEAAFFPGAVFLLSKWYRREELGLRTAILYCGNISSWGFGGLIAAGILGGMDGKLGHAGWRWLFYIEGAITIAVAFAAIFILPGFPRNTQWLDPMERRLAEVRMAEDAGGEADHVLSNEGVFRGFILAVKDWKVWWLALTLITLLVGLSFSTYFPTLSATLGYNYTISLLLVAPPWAFAAVVAFVVSRHADKTGERFYHVACPVAVGIIGFVIAESTTNIAARYTALFLMAQSHAGYIVLFAWISNSLPRPSSKRAVALALCSSFSQLGNIAGSYVWQSKWGKSYRNSYGICIACCGAAVAMCFVFRVHLVALNRRLDNGEVVDGMQRQRDGMDGSAELDDAFAEEVQTKRKEFRFVY
ncbi:hypothetical protein FRC12_004295 [Ceratobasidium sp. 428]|nr:hypothetical protein FRC12_004295 [Ceratobasidium sp. 428]